MEGCINFSINVMKELTINIMIQISSNNRGVCVFVCGHMDIVLT